jgi:hypothetical protein
VSIRSRLERLEEDAPSRYVSIFAVLDGSAPMPSSIDQLEPAHREAAQRMAGRTVNPDDDPMEARLVALERKVAEQDE